MNDLLQPCPACNEFSVVRLGGPPGHRVYSCVSCDIELDESGPKTPGPGPIDVPRPGYERVERGDTMTTPTPEPTPAPADDVPDVPTPQDPDAAPAPQPQDQPVDLDPEDLPETPAQSGPQP